ncbi:MAG: gamma-glutamyl-phosphate reductase, partial [Clostridia bacterium]|nr:gamma-glutamyl-phosphate reductase [Clostridia bacterium]
MALADTESKNRVLVRIAELLEEQTATLIAANREDLDAADLNGVPKAMLDRLALNPGRIGGICEALRALTELEDPVGKGETWTRPSG